MKLQGNGKWPLARFIAPAYPAPNIFSGSKITPLGLVNVAASANTLWGWRVEIIDENNYNGPRNESGLPDHARLQKEDPAAVVGFYCGLTSTMNRAFALFEYYRAQGAVIIAGGTHATFCPEEVLAKGCDIVVRGEGERVIRDILETLQSDADLTYINPGISFRMDGKTEHNPPATLEIPDLNASPYPDFGLIRYARKIRTYPVSRVRGCRMNCEFCSVKGAPRFASPEHVFNLIRWLVDTRGARKFFFVDDRLEEYREGLLALLRLISRKYGNRLTFTVQIRLETAKDGELLEAMSRAGVRTVCIGYESPIAEDLKAMRKGLTPQKMVGWSLILRRYFWVHGMFIFGYPNKETSTLSVPEMVKRYKRFIRKARISSIQVLHPVPLVGTELRERLEREGRIFPLSVASWSRYDGSFACFQPDNMTIAELQETPIQLMKWFYSSWSFLRIPYRTLIFPLHYLVAGWHHWYDGWYRDIVKYGGHRLILRWQRRQRGVDYASELERCSQARHANQPVSS